MYQRTRDQRIKHWKKNTLTTLMMEKKNSESNMNNKIQSKCSKWICARCYVLSSLFWRFNTLKSNSRTIKCVHVWIYDGNEKCCSYNFIAIVLAWDLMLLYIYCRIVTISFMFTTFVSLFVHQLHHRHVFFPFALPFSFTAIYKLWQNIETVNDILWSASFFYWFFTKNFSPN